MLAIFSLAAVALISSVSAGGPTKTTVPAPPATTTSATDIPASTTATDIPSTTSERVTVTTAVPSKPTTTPAGPGPKFLECAAGKSKYFSEVKQCPLFSSVNCAFNCGVTCLTASEYSLDKVFESGLTLASNNNPCAAYPVFTGTETHGWVSLDMYTNPARKN